MDLQSPTPQASRLCLLRSVSHNRIVRDPGTILRTLLELTTHLADELDLDEVLQAITDASVRLFAAQHASLRLLDDRGTELVSSARSGEGIGHAPLVLRPGEGVVGWVIEHGELARVDDVERDSRFKRFTEQPYVIASLLVLPLVSVGRVTGALSITSDKAHHFDAEDEALGRLLANCAVVPLERARLQRLARTDEQTMSWSHAYLMPRLTEELARASPEASISLLLFDLDHFKRVNDAHGHAVGDRVLRAFADEVRKEIRRDDLLFRRGGEEFVVLMPRCDLTAAQQAAERIRHGMATTPIDAGGGIHVDQRVSVGVAQWDGTEGAAAFEGRADAAMYMAKRSGRDRITVAPPSEPAPPDDPSC